MKIGFVGVGNMGRYMAASLIAAGHDLLIHDARPEAMDDPVLKGAQWAKSPAEAARDRDAVVTSLPGPPQVEAVVLGANGVLAGMRAGAVYIDMSTSTPESIRAIAKRAADKSVLVVDAPVAGGTRGARRGELTIMAGGSAEAFAAAEPVLRGMGTKIFHVGDVGAGHVAKLVNNMMTIVNGLVAMEAVSVGVKAGIDPARLIEVAQAGTGGSFSLNVFPYVIFKRGFEPAKFALSLAEKDLRVSVEYANELGVPVDIVAKAAKALADASAGGLGGKDWSSYITLIEQRAGIEVRSDTVPAG